MPRRKRQPGGGRKPTGLTERISVRCTPHLYEKIERSRPRHLRKSDWVIKLLNNSIEYEKSSDRALNAFCYLVTELASGAESNTQRRWRDDPWVFEVFEAAVADVLARLKPVGRKSTPQSVKISAENFGRAGAPAEAVKFHSTPKGVASALVAGIWDQIEIYRESESTPKGVHRAKQFYTMPDVRRDLGIKRQRS